MWRVDDPQLLIREHIGQASIELIGFFVAQAPDMDADGTLDYAVGARLRRVREGARPSRKACT